MSAPELRAVHDGYLAKWAVVDERSAVWCWCDSEAEALAAIERYRAGASREKEEAS